MPTTRPRHRLTETDEIARVVNDATVAWPELRSAAGAATGVYPRNARAELLAEWPQ